MKSHWLMRCWQWKRNIVVGLIVLTALLMTASRIAVVVLSHHTALIEKWLVLALKQPVTIQKIQADWTVFDPGLRFQQVLVQTADGHTPILQINQLTLSVDIFRSLLYWRLLPRRIKVQGVNLDIDQEQGHLQVRGILSNKSRPRLSHKSTSLQRFLMGLLAEGHVSVRDANVNYHATDHHTYYLKHIHFTVKNHSIRTKVSGDAILDFNLPDDASQARQPTQLRFSAQLNPVGFKHNKINAEMYLQLNHVQLKQWAHSPWLKPYVKSIAGLRGSSDLEVWVDWHNTKISAIEGRWQLRHVKWMQQAKPLVVIPRIQAFFSWHATDPLWVFKARPFYVSFPALYRSPLSVNALSAHFQWRQTNGNDQLYVSNYRWDIDRLQSWGQFNVLLPASGKPRLDVISHYRLPQLALIPRLIPDVHRSLSSASWLKNAEFQGRLATGTIVYRGPIEAMPFQQQDAHLSAEFQVRQAGLNYYGHWPALRHLNSNIVVNNRQITAVFRQARIGHVPVETITARIHDMLHPELLIDSRIKTNLAGVNDFLKDSPMRLSNQQPWTAKRLSQWPIALGLQLGIDFNHPAVRINTEGTLGMLHSSMDFTIRTPKKNQQLIQLHGKLDMAAIKQRLPLPILHHITGHLPYRVDIHMAQPHKNRWQIDIDSHHHVWVRLLAALKNHRIQWQRGAAYIGEKASSVHPMVPGFVIYGQMTTFHWPQWKAWIIPFIHMEHGVIKMPEILGLPLRYIELYFDRFYAFHQAIDNLYFKLVPRPRDWMIDMKSTKIMGSFFLPKQSGDRWIGRLDYVYFPKKTEKNPSKRLSIDPRKIPPLDITIQRVDYGKMDLGTVTLMTQPNLYGTTINTFSIRSPLFTFSMKGQWQQYVHQQTMVSGWFKTHNLGAVLTASGVKETIVKGEGSSHFQLNWLAGLGELKADALNGKIDFNFQHGRLLKTNGQSTQSLSLGRIINAFSLSALPKRLTLHFSDITAKGLEFRVLKGDFLLKNGVFHTSDTVLDGPVARLNITGSINFPKKHYHVDTKVLPYVTSSVPLIVGIVGGPIAGAIAWLVNKLAAPQIAKAISFHYDTAGDFDPPAVQLPLPTSTREVTPHD